MLDSSRLASDLEALMTGALGEVEFEQLYVPQRAESSLLQAIWGGLAHYLSDADIRARDERYRALQDGEMAKLILLIRQGAPLAELGQISFLQRT